MSVMSQQECPMRDLRYSNILMTQQVCPVRELYNVVWQVVFVTKIIISVYCA